jgi:hypothetical protein
MASLRQKNCVFVVRFRYPVGGITAVNCNVDLISASNALSRSGAI